MLLTDRRALLNRLTSRYLENLVAKRAVIAMERLQRLMEDAEMLADVRAYDAAKSRLEDGEDELIPLEITERRLAGEAALRIWRERWKLTQERLAKKAKGIARADRGD